MPLSDSTLNEIRNELVGLHQVQAQVNDRIKALEAILTPLDLGQGALPFQRVQGGTIPSGSKVFPPSVTQTPSPYAGTGLRAAILDILRTLGPMRSPQVAKALGRLDFKNDSKTPLPTRVYNDLWRMSQKGTVLNDNGVFSVRK